MYPWVQAYHSIYFGYQQQSPYVNLNGAIIDAWTYDTDQDLTALPDLVSSMTMNPALRVLVQHGYYDLNTVFHESELDLARAGLFPAVPVKLYAGRHGVSPFDTESYDRLLADLDSFYDGRQPPMIAALNARADTGANP